MERTEITNTLRMLEEELADSEVQLAALGRRTDHLKQAVEGLRGLLGMTIPEPLPMLPEPIPAEATTTSATVEVPAATATAAAVAPERPQIGEAVEAVVVGAKGPMTLRDIEREMRRRGWLDPNLKRPDASIYQAARRLSDGASPVERIEGAVPARFHAPVAEMPSEGGRPMPIAGMEVESA